MSKRPVLIQSLLAVTTMAFLFAASSAHAVCGDDILDGIEQCDGGGCCETDCTFTSAATVCRPAVNVTCDVQEACVGNSGECPADVLVGCVDTDAVACTVPACGVDGLCFEADECVEVCRGPGYWSTHSGSEKEGVNIGQSVIDAAGPLLVCGESIELTDDLGTLQSALEALCVRTQGVKERQLFRQLVTTALNCSISEGGTCDQILDRFVDVSFSDCNALCAGDPVVDGPTLQECKSQLSCFNEGGRLIDGQCAHGTCAEAPETYCGGEFDDCPLIADLPQECVDFEDNCTSEAICNEELDAPAQICPEKKRASSPKTCKQARHNECTIDSCEP